MASIKELVDFSSSTFFYLSASWVFLCEEPALWFRYNFRLKTLEGERKVEDKKV